ncbi:MAG TPA: MFS transporter [Sumerlaeia bacterium]|nr:MFS transporter [Sumerlaeia bacterium]
MALSADPKMRRWQIRVFSTVYVTYFSYYLCRYNMPVAKTTFTNAFQWSAEEFGAVFTALTLLYAVGQFVNGQLGDRFGARIVSSIGVLGSVLMNLCVFALVMTANPATADHRRILWLHIFFWGANGFFQSMGWSPMVRVMAHWFPVEGRGKVTGLVGTCYQLGAAAASLLAIFLTGFYVTKLSGDWRMVFLVPAVIFGAVGLFFFFSIRNDPADVGLPPVDPEGSPAGAGAPPAERGREERRTLAENLVATLRNPYLWVVAGAFFMLDVNRYGFVNWMPAFLDERAGAHASPLIAGLSKSMKICIHPLAGSVGALTAGWATDRFFGGRRAPVIAILLLFLGLFSFLFPLVDANNTPLVVLVVALVGFCTYGPHILMVGHAAQDFGKKAGASGAAGFIDCMGYIGASLAGWGAGRMIDAYDFERTFFAFGWAALLGAAFACVIWKAGPRMENAPDARTES